MSISLQPQGLQHARLPCPSPTPGAYLNSCPLSRWCHPIISPSVIPFSSCPQSFPASGSFQMSQIFILGGQSIGVSNSISPSNEHPGLIYFRMDWLDLFAVQDIRMLITHTHTHTQRTLITILCIIEEKKFNIRRFFIWINILIYTMEYHKIIKKQVFKIDIVFS